MPPVAMSRPRWWPQVLLVVGFTVGYDEVRALHGDVASAGMAHGRDLLWLDHALRIDWVRPLNAWLSTHQSLGAALSYYYFVMHLGMTALVLTVLWLRSDRYRWYRDVLVASSLVALVVFWVYPVAPPRMLAGFHDTVRDVVPAAYHLEAANANLYAAMPSLHVAWAAWCGIALWALSRSPWVRVVAVAHPVITAVTVLATGNHYTVDVLAGVALMALVHPLWRLVAASEFGERRVAQQQPLGADVAAEVDLRLGLLGAAAYGDHPAQAE